jgi:hypothetical protein
MAEGWRAELDLRIARLCELVREMADTCGR